MPTAKEETKDIFSSSASESRHKMFSVTKFMISNQVRFLKDKLISQHLYRSTIDLVTSSLPSRL